MSTDPEDNSPEPQLGRKFSFRGKELAGFSWGARATLYRLMAASTPVMEEYAYLVYLLMSKSPVEMDQIRTDEQISQFRVEAGEWAERQGLADGKGWDELKAVATDIIEASKKAESLEPKPTQGGKKKLGK